MAILGGSPLGLINTKSLPVNGRSTFNGGSSRNVSVEEYNKSKAGSLFTGKRIIRAWPEIRQKSDGVYDTAGEDDVDYKKLKAGDKSGDTYKRKTLHSNNIYDTSILNIVESLAETKAALRPADFAYLKDVGVYPNNRLMVARRFAGPIGDNIMTKKKNTEVGSLATLISWQPQGTDFLSINFGEKWTDAEADFKNILNRIGGDFSKSQTSKLGDIIGGGAGLIPLPTFTEIFQRKLLSNLGFLDESGKEISDENLIPSGNPNLIKEAKRRTLVGYESAGSGLSCTVEITMACEWEMKFISGLDPTIVWMDILAMVTRFGTSPSNSYGFGNKMASKLNEWMNNPKNLVRDIVNEIKNALIGIKEELLKTINSIVESGKKLISGESTGTASVIPDVAGMVTDFANTLLEGTALKYRVEILGVVNALTGNPSTPWHITIGNPMRPIFCSGDMLTTNVKVTLGPTLGFNDLPSTIKADFTLTNARPWGMQEIMAKFNSGYLRTVDVQKTFYETKANELPGMMPWDNTTVKDDGAGGTASVGATASKSFGVLKSDKNTEANAELVGIMGNSKTKAEGGKLPVNAPLVAVRDTTTTVNPNVPPIGQSTTSGQLSTAASNKFFPKKT